MKQIFSVITEKRHDIQSWLESRWKGLMPPVYLSCDLRHSGEKIAVVDSNLYPAGFNNLCKVFSQDAISAFDRFFRTHYPSARSICLFVEEHTRNKYYLKNVQRLASLLRAAGKEVVVAVSGGLFTEPSLTIDLDNEPLVLHRAAKEGSALKVAASIPDLILSNNDFSNGLPDVLKSIDQTIIPSPNLGWFNRRKSRHFEILRDICNDFAGHFSVDPWKMNALFDVSGPVNLDEDSSLAGLAQKTQNLIARIGEKYREYGITDAPYVYLKNNSGTYGMGLLPVFSGDEVLTLNRKKRNKLLSSKGSAPVTEFILQEGVPTIDSYSGYPIEPVIYSVGGSDIGGFFRIHESKNALESLNAPGMTFSCLCLHKLDEPHENFFIDCREKEKLVVLSRFLGRLDNLACALEMKEIL